MKTLDEVIGHFEAKKLLLTNRQIRSWLFCGVQGIGKATLAHAFSRFLVADYKITHHPDIMIVTATEGLIDVNKIKNLKSFLSLSPIMSDCKVAIIDCIDNLNENATNAMLKFIEEPSSTSVILLISHRPHSLPKVLTSRCMRLALLRLSDEETISVLQQRNLAVPFSTQSLYEGTPGLISDDLDKEIALQEYVVSILNGASMPIRIDLFAVSIDKIHRVLERCFIQVIKNLVLNDASNQQKIMKFLDRWADINKILVDTENFYLDKSQVIFTITQMIKM